MFEYLWQGERAFGTWELSYQPQGKFFNIKIKLFSEGDHADPYTARLVINYEDQTLLLNPSAVLDFRDALPLSAPSTVDTSELSYFIETLPFTLCRSQNPLCCLTRYVYDLEEIDPGLWQTTMDTL